MQQIIETNSFDMFMLTIAALVEKGLTFKADADSLIITLTGGH